MDVSAFAARVLLGPTLEDKLLAPANLSDDRRAWRGALPEQPGRVDELGLARGRAPKAPMQVPDTLRERGWLLHAFANHELLATELLALALLRFTDAPAAFRRGLLQTLREEQRHLALYLERMNAMGVAMGDRPSSGFFWRAMSGIDSPRVFVAHLSLTFEQANLDFATHYRDAFAAAGDTRTAAVLQTVLDDEVGHVALGLRWFERWRDSDRSLFEAHRDALEPPLQIVRAKATVFDPAPRRRAGLPESYIDRLRTSGGSRGRLGRVWWFNGAVEHEVEHGMRYTPSASTRATVRDLETVPMLLAAEADVVLVHRLPTPQFLDTVRAAGIVLPRFEKAELSRSPWSAPKRLGPISDLRPWGVSPRADAFAATARVRACGEVARWHPRLRALYDKRTAARLAAALPEDPCWTTAGLAPRVASSWAELERVRTAFAGLGHATRVKPIFGASGRGQRVLRDAADRAFVEAMLARSGAVVLEPQFEVLAQFSLRMRVDEGGATVTGVGRCASTLRGQFSHAVLGAPDAGLPGPLRRWLRGDGGDPRRLDRVARTVADVVGPEAAAAGLRGPLGVDALLVQTSAGPRLRPLVDLNPRLTMGHVAAGLRAHVSPRTFAVLRAVSRTEVHGGDFGRWSASLPAPSFDHRNGRRRLVGGTLCLTDPARAQHVAMVLSAASTLDDALSASLGRR